MTTRIRLTDVLAQTAKPKAREYALRDSIVRGFSLRVRPSGAKTWTVRTRQGRFAISEVCSMPAVTARQRAHAMLSGLAAPRPAKTSTVTLKTFAATYLQRKARVWRAATLRTQKSYLESRLVPALGHRPLDQIRPPDVGNWFHEYSQSRPGGANRAIAVLSDMFTQAQHWGLLPAEQTNPCAAVRKNRPRRRGQMINEEALGRLGAALERLAVLRPALAAAIRLLLLTGARPGEIFRLQWEEVEDDRIVLSQTKRGPRSIPLGRVAQTVVAKQRKATPPSRFVFPHQHLPDRPIALPSSRMWGAIKREAGLPPNLRLYDLRHNFASHALLAGETLLVAGSLLGHSRPTMTARYAHLVDDQLLRAAQTIASSLSALAATI